MTPLDKDEVIKALGDRIDGAWKYLNVEMPKSDYNILRNQIVIMDALRALLVKP